MASVIRITQCSYSPVQDRYILSVDVMHGADSVDLDRTYIIIAERRSVTSLEELKVYVENEIESQTKKLPDWSGTTWKSTIE